MYLHNGSSRGISISRPRPFRPQSVNGDRADYLARYYSENKERLNAYRREYNRRRRLALYGVESRRRKSPAPELIKEWKSLRLNGSTLKVISSTSGFSISTVWRHIRA